jgi:3-oxoacyl-[acyl-carrier-protein] synthase-3
MKFKNVSVLSVAHVEAPHRITSDQIGRELAPTYDRFGIGYNMIESLTGIVARRFWDEGVLPSAVATTAGELAIERAGIDRSRLGILINSSVCRDYIEPSTACIVHGNLGLAPHCLNYDVGNACLAFLNGMEIIGLMIERGQVDYGIVVDGESSRYAVQCTIQRLLSPDCDMNVFRDNFATLTLGSGAAAMVLARSDLAPEGHRLIGSVAMAATQYNQLCRGQVDEMVTDPSTLLTAGLALAIETYKKAQEELGWGTDSLDEYVTHQVSKVHVAKFINMLGMSDEKFFKTFPEYGNIGPAALPFTLSKSLETGRINKGDRIGLLGIGSGLNCSMMEVAW